MNTKIPFTKDINFEKKISEITSISLEHEINVSDDILKGNFIVSGDFKSHEVSVNKEPFSYMLPFEIDIDGDIDTKTIEFMIDDFTYEIIDNTVLRVNIDFNIIASKKEIESESIDSLFVNPDNLFNDDAIKEKTDNQDEKSIEENEPQEREEIINESEQSMPEVIGDNNDVFNAEKIENTNPENKIDDTIINSINNTSDDYAIYHIHMVSDGETVETICSMYNSNMNILGEYNNLQDINAGDKIIIPDKNE